MTYEILKAIHLLAVIGWIGGMLFTLTFLRPSLAVLEGPARLRLMDAVLGRFLTAVNLGIVLILVTGIWMFWVAFQVQTGAGGRFQMPPGWSAMIGLGLVMMGIFGFLRGRLYRRLQAAVAGNDTKAGAATMDSIRRWVMVNLVLGVVIVIAMKVGGSV